MDSMQLGLSQFYTSLLRIWPISHARWPFCKQVYKTKTGMEIKKTSLQTSSRKFFSRTLFCGQRTFIKRHYFMNFEN